ncbi:MAG: hypothetical protein KA116_08625 [Proteobacteria bacterium]|nr:hypothetical protein [Pseudomonadota bacterium]
MPPLRLNLSIFLFIISLNSIAKSPNVCNELASLIAKKVLEPNRGLHNDAERGSADPYWNRLSQVLRTTDAKDLENIFYPSGDMTAFELYDSMFWGIKSGEIKADGKMDRLVTELRDFVVENPKAFEQEKDRAFHILKALEAADKMHNFSGDPTLAARSTMRAIGIAEESLLARAVAESTRGKKYANRKWYDGMYRFFSPHYKRMLRILDFNNNIRARMQQDFLADEPVTDTLLRFEKELKSQDTEALRGLVADTPGKLKEARDLVEKVYKRELSYTDPLREADQRLFDLDKIMAKSDSEAEFHQAVRESERDMDSIDLAHKRYRDLEKLGPRPFDDYHPTHLQIRQTQYKRETETLHNAYEDVLERNPENPAYDVHAHWTVTEHYTTQETEHYTDNEGRSQTRQVTRHHTYTFSADDDFVVNARYEEVIDGQLKPRESEINTPYVSGPHGGTTFNGSPTIDKIYSGRSDEILENGAKARVSEKPFRDRIDSVMNWVESVRENYPKNISKDEDYKTLLKKFSEIRKELEKSRKDYLEEYQNWVANKVNGQWKQDKPQDFKDRNTYLHERFRHMVNTLDHFQEQIRRKQKPLNVTYELPDYKKQLEILRKIYIRNRTIQGVGGGIIAISGVLYGVYYDEVNEEVKGRYEKLKSILNKEDGNSPLKQEPWDYSNGLPPLERVSPYGGRNASDGF